MQKRDNTSRVNFIFDDECLDYLKNKAYVRRTTMTNLIQDLIRESMKIDAVKINKEYKRIKS